MLFAATAFAQNNGGQRQRLDPTEMYTRMADRLVKQLKIEDDKAEVFKILYLDYQTARHNAANPKGESNNERVNLKSLTDEKANELIQKQFATTEAQLAVDKDYLKKFLEILTPAQAAQIFVPSLSRQGFQNGGQRQGGRPGGMGGGQRGGFGGGFGGDF